MTARVADAIAEMAAHAEATAAGAVSVDVDELRSWMRTLADVDHASAGYLHIIEGSRP